MIALNEKFINFIKCHQNDDIAELMLKYKDKNLDFDLEYAITQIKCRKKTKNKLPSYNSNPYFLYPSSLSAEQSTDEEVARFHTTMTDSAETLLDMSAGLGIDVLTAAPKIKNVTAIDIDIKKIDHLIHNSNILGINNISCICDDSIEWINSQDRIFDVIFIDPARRGEDGKRLYSLSDCKPDIVANLNNILSKCKKLIIKASPLLDITQVIRELRGITEIFVVCAHNECKEVLAVAIPDGKLRRITAVDLSDCGQHRMFHFDPDEMTNDYQVLENTSDLLSGFIYEPNAALMKINCSSKLCQEFPGLKKLSSSTNLYHSDALFDNFPGKSFEIISLPDKKALKKLSGEHINTISRNYVMKADDISKKFHLRPGTDNYLIGACITPLKLPFLILCKKLPEAK